MSPTAQSARRVDGEDARPLLHDHSAGTAGHASKTSSSVSKQHWDASGGRSQVVGSLAQVLFLAAVGLYTYAQAMYMSPSIQVDWSGLVGPYFGIPLVTPPAGSPLTAYGHYELLLPSFFVLFCIIPLFTSLVLFEFVRDYTVHRHTSHFVLRVSAALRRKPPSLFGWAWHYDFCYGELLFLVGLIGGNVITLVYAWVNQRKFLPRAGEEYTFNTVLELAGVAFGYNSVFNMAFLFLPCTRHCAWMEFFNVSYANSIKYHRWLGVASLVTAVLHGVPFYWLWQRQGVLAEKALPCFDCQTDYWHIGYPKWFNVFGEISLFFMIVLSVASIPWVRRQLFETFYYLHHLYIPTVVFAVLHWGSVVWWLLPTLALYLISRAISRWNSLFPVQVREFKALPDGIVKIVVARSVQHSGNFDVGQFVYLNVPAISKLQWHAFTIGSSPRTTPDSLTILLKSLGDWTQDLVEYAHECERTGANPAVYMDGYYGASLEEYEEYPTLCLVGGGIGATPLFAMLEDMAVRQTIPQSLPRQRVFFIFTFRELALLEEVYPTVIKLRQLDPRGEWFSFRFFLTRTPHKAALDTRIDYDRLNSSPMADDGSGDASRRPVRSFGRWTIPKPFVEPLRNRTYKTVIYCATLLPAVVLIVWLDYDGGVLMQHRKATQYWPLQNFADIAVLFMLPVVVYAALVVEWWFSRVKSSQSDDASEKVTLQVANANVANYSSTSAKSSSWMNGLSDVVTLRDLLDELDVKCGQRPDMAKLVREVHDGHHADLKQTGSSRTSPMGKTIGVFISGPEALKRSTEAAVDAIGALEFDIHEEEFEL